MTNDMNLRQACETLATRLGGHIRILQAVASDNDDLATRLLQTRMHGVMRDWANDEMDYEDLAQACEVIDNSPGPLASDELNSAAEREIASLSH